MKSLPLIAFASALLLHVQAQSLFKFKTIRRPVPPNAGEPLILTPLIEAGKIEEAKNQSLVTYEAFKNVAFYSGFFQVDKDYDNNLFFYFFPSENDYLADPVVLWLQGGPGAPSAYGLFMENGPFVVKRDNSVDLREYRWSRNQSVLYIDSPVGTGFSFTNKQGYAENQTKVGDDLYGALTQFFTLFSELQQNDFYIFGESYGGKYVPAIGHAIQKNNPSADLKINLKGLSTGNGLSDPYNQGDYGDYLYQLGLVDANTRDQLKEYNRLSRKSIEEEDWTQATSYFDDAMMGLISEATGVTSVYNYVELDEGENEYWQPFIQEQARDALHVGNIEFQNGPTFEYLYDDIAKSVAPWIAELLSTYRYLVYSGQVDIIVGFPMSDNFLRHLDFDSAAEFERAQRDIWVDGNDAPVGYYKKAGNLTELLIRNAGHMVPIDQPKWAYQMVYNWIRNRPFETDFVL